jgi:hypothetical protein
VERLASSRAWRRVAADHHRAGSVTPGDLLQPIAGRLRPQVEAKGLTLRVEIDPAAAEGALRKCASYSNVPRRTINATVK